MPQEILKDNMEKLFFFFLIAVIKGICKQISTTALKTEIEGGEFYSKCKLRYSTSIAIKKCILGITYIPKRMEHTQLCFI